jgi:DNA-binding NarL/FixJ family response regulator
MELNPPAGNHNTSYRILVVDDHPTVREGLSHRIGAQPNMSVCGSAADVNEALQVIPHVMPDLAIIDISLKSSDGLELVKAIATRHPQVRTLVHSMYDETIYADRCLSAGARGYVNKESDPDEVIKAIREIMAGRVYLSRAMTDRILGRACRPSQHEGLTNDVVSSLTDRQLEVFRLIGDGLGVREISERLHISIHTVETHRENMKRKLNIDKLSDLNRRAVLWVRENR